MRHVLLSVVGNTPQVVTETLYAMHRQGRPWPEEIKIVTTTMGKSSTQCLLDNGILKAMCDELGVKTPKFTIDDILVVPDAMGAEVADARTVDDHEALADFIMTTVRNLTAEPTEEPTAVHASLAGGRKTMTFYLGYAMSLFGRAQDSLSHVLVSPEYENVADFFYPSPKQGEFSVKKRDGSENRLDSTAAKVELADIPFIRHRGSLPTILAQKGRKVNFRTLVGLINLGEQPEQIRLILDCGSRTLRVTNADGSLHEEVQLRFLEFAFYLMMTRSTLESESDMSRPARDRPDVGLAKLFCDELLTLCGLSPCKTLLDSLKALDNWSAEQEQFTVRTSKNPKDAQRDAQKLRAVWHFEPRTLDNLGDGISTHWFDQRLNGLKVLLQEALPLSVVKHLLPRIIWTEDGERLNGKVTKKGGYGIGLPPENITIKS